MTIDRRIEESLPSILTDLGRGPAPDYADLVLARTAQARQRPVWLLPDRWLPRVTTPAIAGHRMVPVLGLLALSVALAAAAVYVGTRPRLPAPFGPARNGAIVFSSAGDIATGSLGAPAEFIVRGPEVDFEPFYSPNGTRIAFYRQFGETPGAATDIMVMNPDGTGLTRITATPLLEIPWSASWTPDGNRIVVQTNERLDGRLLSFDAAGDGPPVAIDQAAREHDLRIDSFAFQPPDGRRILFTGQSGSLTGLFAMDSDGTHLTTLIEPYLATLAENSDGYWNDKADIKDLRNPIWSPDGKHIVVQQYDVTPEARWMRLFMLDSDGGNPHPITNPVDGSVDGDAAWSPDGTRIAFVRYDLDRSVWRYAIVRLTDLNVTMTGPDIVDGKDADEWSPGAPIITWAPDSSRLFALERAGPRDAYLLDPDGGQYETLPWAVQTPQSWGIQGLNSLDLGSWQRKAGP
ncbi:MAG: TolB family protein [Chloroflexota bacterium]